MTGYRVNYISNGSPVSTGSQHVNPSVTSADLTGLISDGHMYNITVAAKSEHIPGVSDVKSVVLLSKLVKTAVTMHAQAMACFFYAHADAPSGVHIAILSQSVRVTWNAAPDAVSYTVSYVRQMFAGQKGLCEDKQHSGNVTNIVTTSIDIEVDDVLLEAFSTYSLTAIAVNDTKGRSEESQPVLFTTPQKGN